jgi:hypothetical protein
VNKYIVRDVVCDWGICSVDDLGKEELVEVCNSKANAELICEILNTDLMKDDKYTIWKDKKISDLETKIEEKDKAIENWQTIYESVVQTCHNDKEEIERLNKQLAISEKQCELMAQHIREDLKCDYDEDDIYDYFKNEAKDMMESE